MSRYGIFRKIGGGGMGMVYEGEGRLSERKKMVGWFTAEWSRHPYAARMVGTDRANHYAEMKMNRRFLRSFNQENS
jgi:hypothetical protein